MVQTSKTIGHPGARAQTAAVGVIRGDISVRALAEFVCRRGDLYLRTLGRSVDAEEGIAAQRIVQAKRLAEQPGYLTEVALAHSFACGEGQRQLKGRIDGLLAPSFPQDALVLVEEFKCVGELPDQAHPIDWGQAWIYAGLYAVTHSEVETLTVQLVYVHADTFAERCFSQTISAEQAKLGLSFLLLCYVTRVERHLQRNLQRSTWAQTLAFPMAQYRPSQQAIARRVFKAVAAKENLLLEAPTGSGKTLAILYPAVKAQQLQDQLFFLTSRNAGSFAAMSALEQLDPQRTALCVVEIVAKEKVCPVEGMPCDPALCKYAAGYFDRAGEAVNVLLQDKRATRAHIAEVAQAHQVCPFELSLDAALWADVICGDYNYVFDPIVRLQRFAGHKQLHLLVDEAHQISPRVRDMLSVEMQRADVQRAKKTSHPQLKKRAASIDRALLKLRREFGHGEHTVTSVESLTRACLRLCEVVAELDVELSAHPEVMDLYFGAWRWGRSQSWYTSDEFKHLLTVADKQVSVRRSCLDAAPYLEQLYDEHGAVIRFSGTVTPLALYQRLHGVPEASGERAGGPFSSAQALVMVVPDVPTYYRQREASLPKLVQLVTSLVSAYPGRYLIALPSYAYLEALVAAAAPAWGGLFQQRPGMDQAATENLLAEFANTEQGVLFIVMGGILGESVDFADTQIHGVMLVGLGLPPPSLERNLMEKHFDQQEGDGWGRMVAYTQPALVKNIQAAGRMLRSEDDAGVICLVDARFTSAQVQQFFPSYWQPEVTVAAEVARKTKAFWQGCDQAANRQTL